ncbi:MAG: hypothetical protein LBR58_02810 [Propionibacteriaceae bacterium]|jgi:hypothetical protein|nr:hypothetical protein [Propionibacteriaceae bacterium]
MGLFDKLIKSAVSDALQDVVKDAVSQAFGVEGDQAQPAPAQQAPVQQAADAPAAAAAEQLGDRAAFKAMLAAEFPDLEVREDTPVSALGGEGKPYDLGLYRAGAPVGMVMLTPHNRDNNAAFKGAKAAAAAAGVPFINFYTHMANERSYCVERIRRLTSN